MRNGAPTRIATPTNLRNWSFTDRLTNLFLFALGALLVGYMFLGRGFAHLGLGPVFVGELVLGIGILAVVAIAVGRGLKVRMTAVAWLLVGFIVIGVVRTFPFVGTYGMDALRDGVLWGYGIFALVIYAVMDRTALARAVRGYGYVVPVFLLWLPMSYEIFARLSTDIDADEMGSNVPLIFFKSGDMAVHIVGSVAFLILGAIVATRRQFIWRVALAVPLLWTAFIAIATNRGALLTIATGVVLVAIVGVWWHRSRNWLPFIVAPAILAASVALGSVAAGILDHSVVPAGAGSTSPPVSALPTGSASASGGDVTCDPAPASRSLAANPGFEIGTLEAGLVEGWQTAAGQYDIVAGRAYRGSNFVTVQSGEPWTAAITSSRFPFSAGQDMAVTFRASAIEGAPVLNTYVHWYDSAGDRISSPGMTSLKTEAHRQWQESSGVLTAPAGTAYAEVQIFESAGDATVGIDEVIVMSGDFVPAPPGAAGRDIAFDQVFANIASIFSSTSHENLEGSKEFRVRWWRTIIDYTIFGDYFWTGKGFGINLADADGFQANADGSLRAPHNSHLTVLARMGVPGFVAWIVLQVAFVVSLVRSVIVNRLRGSNSLAFAGVIVLLYWAAMMVDTSFDPYLEGPQGGIWFWTIFGVGMVVARATHGLPRGWSTPGAS